MSSVCIKERWEGSICWITLSAGRYEICQPIGGSSYTLIYSARTDLDADIPADIPGNAICELADRLVKEARRAEEARLRLELSERARSTLEAELADERRRREETERERDELRQELEALKLEVLRESREEAPESPESPGPVDRSTDAGEAAQEAAERPDSEAPRSWWRRMFGG